jgi:isohexenylglutaconyl-CoA hydratase
VRFEDAHIQGESMNQWPPIETLQLDQQGGWLTLWLNRPEARNALSAQMVDELITTLDAVAKDPAIRGLSMRGRGGVFCAGGDLKGFRSGLQSGEQDLAGVQAASRRAGELFSRIDSMPQVVLMLVEGPAMAGGLGMVCAGDVVAVTDNASFALTEVTLGIPPAQIAPFVVARLGLRTARRLMLTAARFGAQEAVRIGLADHHVADAAGLDAVEAEVKKAVQCCAPGANAVTKDILLATERLHGAAMHSYAAQGFARCMLGEEGREGIASFLEKRQPAWAL